MGNYNTILGLVDPTVAVNCSNGNGNTIIGPTDNTGRVSLNKTMAIGIGARANTGTIAIGAYAISGEISDQQITANNTQIEQILSDVQEKIKNDNDEKVKKIISAIISYKKSTTTAEKKTFLKEIFSLQNIANIAQIASLILQLSNLVTVK